MKDYIAYTVLVLEISAVVFILGYQHRHRHRHSLNTDRIVTKVDALPKEERVAIAKDAKKTLESIRMRYIIEGQQIEIYMVGESYSKVDLPILIQIESSGNPNAVSPAGARGLCQITENTWNECIVYMKLLDWDYWECWNDPVKNEAVGMFYINNRIPSMLNYYNLPDVIDARLACYNWGIGNVRKAYAKGSLQQSLPKETKNYILKYHIAEMRGKN